MASRIVPPDDPDHVRPWFRAILLRTLAPLSDSARETYSSASLVAAYTRDRGPLPEGIDIMEARAIADEVIELRDAGKLDRD